MPTRDEIEKAIERIRNGNDWCRSNMSGLPDDYLKDYDIAIACMQEQIKEPTDEDVQRAIEWMKNIAEHAEVILDEMKAKEPHVSPMLYKRRSELAKVCITALRQYQRTEPCEWCDKVLMLFTASGKFIPENQPPKKHCPNCGRKLGG